MHMKVIVVGNGFDLHCNLKSSFNHFYEGKIKNDVTKIRSNIWYLLLYFRFYRGAKEGVCELVRKDNILWMDVENFISQVLNSGNGAAQGHPLAVINHIFKDGPSYPSNTSEFDFVQYGSFALQRNELALLIDAKAKTKDSYEFLMDELLSFEKDFSEYLLQEETKNINYKYESNDLIQSIAKHSGAFIISFNYTLASLKNNILHVHGNLKENNIIIGTDISTLANPDERAFRFAKSWRKMLSNTANMEIPAKESVTELVFYGHSLSQQDYSYFHALFNLYDIYDSNIVLTFLYSDYEYLDSEKTIPDVKKNEHNKQVYIDKVFSLLRAYVRKTLTQYEADAVITKIQLENRLKVLKLEDYFNKRFVIKTNS